MLLFAHKYISTLRAEGKTNIHEEIDIDYPVLWNNLLPSRTVDSSVS
jgi:hypothetical protein